jgi:hypothetical protein
MAVAGTIAAGVALAPKRMERLSTPPSLSIQPSFDHHESTNESHEWLSDEETRVGLSELDQALQQLEKKLEGEKQ